MRYHDIFSSFNLKNKNKKISQAGRIFFSNLLTGFFIKNNLIFKKSRREAKKEENFNLIRGRILIFYFLIQTLCH